MQLNVLTLKSTIFIMLIVNYVVLLCAVHQQLTFNISFPFHLMPLHLFAKSCFVASVEA